jgi:hypothetical protein
MSATVIRDAIEKIGRVTARSSPGYALEVEIV